VLSDVDLELDPGEVVALVGPTGSGKSTVASVLLGFAVPTAGRVTVGGVGIAGCEMALWRRSVAWVPQRPTVFRGTVAENIRLGRPSAPARAVREAAELAGADAFIRNLADGYETAVGEGGRPLSAGQRQRIALARAFVRRAPLVVLDEPTANVDAATAATIGEAIARLGGEHTVLVIAHAPDVVRRADRVVGLTAGRVADDRRAVAAP
jgi:ABC-type multidrug transport system fused ATPase/permease subunit